MKIRLKLMYSLILILNIFRSLGIFLLRSIPDFTPTKTKMEIITSRSTENKLYCNYTEHEILKTIKCKWMLHEEILDSEIGYGLMRWNVPSPNYAHYFSCYWSSIKQKLNKNRSIRCKPYICIQWRTVLMNHESFRW